MSNCRWILSLFLLLLTSFSPTKSNVVNDDMMVAPPIMVVYKTNAKGLHQFMNALAKRESNNKYWIISKRGYLGKYQFQRKTLNAIGFNYPDSVFLNSELLQDSAMIALIRRNDRLTRSLWKYRGHYIDGVYVSRSGLIAAAHLIGPKAVAAIFDTTLHYRTYDSNGTTGLSYMKLFGGYDIMRF